MQWEYRIKIFSDFDPVYIEGELNGWGEDGWELVNVSASLRTYFFKRPLEEKEERC